MEKFKFGEHEVLMGEFTIDQDTDIAGMFTMLWEKVSKQSPQLIGELFEGVDVGRKSLIDIFETEENFIATPRHTKTGFLFALNAALQKAVLERELHLANGISLFILWTVSVIKEDNKAKKLIETSFSDARSKYDI